MTFSCQFILLYYMYTVVYNDFCEGLQGNSKKIRHWSYTGPLPIFFLKLSHFQHLFMMSNFSWNHLLPAVNVTLHIICFMGHSISCLSLTLSSLYTCKRFDRPWFNRFWIWWTTKSQRSFHPLWDKFVWCDTGFRNVKTLRWH